MITGEKIAVRGQGGQVITPDPRVGHYPSFWLQTHYVKSDVERPSLPARMPVIRIPRG